MEINKATSPLYTFLKKYSFIVILLVFTAHSFLMNGHKHVHNQLTIGTYIDPIASEAFPELFNNSIFVQAVERTNVRLCIVYPIYPWIYKNFDFENFILLQTFVSLAFMLAGIFSLTKTLFGSSKAGLIAMLLYTATLNSWTLGSPAPYLNFFHQGLHYTYPLICWSFVYFFRNHVITACFLAGLAWNFHPMCAAFLSALYGVYFLLNILKTPFRTTFLCAAAFILSALPMLIMAMGYTANTNTADPLWLKGVLWGAWYTCFPATWPLAWFVRAGLFFMLFVLSLLMIPGRERRNKILIFVSTIGLLCIIGTIFADFIPVPFIIRLSLWRSTFLYLLLALPCIAYLLCCFFQQNTGKKILAAVTLVVLTGYVKDIGYYCLLPMLVLFLYAEIEKRYMSTRKWHAANFNILLAGCLLSIVAYQAYRGYNALETGILFSLIILSCIYFNRITTNASTARSPRYVFLRLFFVVLLFDLYVLISIGGPQIYYQGSVAGKPDPWADIQKAAQRHSLPDDLFIIPPYLNDFGIYSLRASLGDWAEGGNIIYLDNRFAHEWFERMNDLGWKTKFGAKQGYNGLTTDQIIATAAKYDARFVITEKPKTFLLDPLYKNEQFVLYQIPNEFKKD